MQAAFETDDPVIGDADYICNWVSRQRFKSIAINLFTAYYSMATMHGRVN
jgi:hypothetical protein